ncbi:aspartate 1-decarboxylase [Streptomyces noursei]|uniref:aspartate 1-decarboxylase n=1 Tax=Streptomyces noursei TaxID=1971 RepID=UPI0030F0F827
MFRSMLKSKIHRATVTQADLNYVGSLTLDPDLMEAADLLPYEQIHVVNINNGARFETYIIEGERGTGMVKINGAAARLVQEGDLVIIIGYALIAEESAKGLKPNVVFVDEENRILEESHDPALAGGQPVLGDRSS